MQPITIEPTEIACERGFKSVVFAKDQLEYIPLPALSDGNIVITKWELTDKDIKDIFDNRVIYLKVMTFGQSLQPVMLTTKIEEL